MYNPKNRVFQNITSCYKAAEYAMGIARKKVENNNIELIALHVIHSEIKHVYSTYYDGSVKVRLREL
jgi:hypothetical protein